MWTIYMYIYIIIYIIIIYYIMYVIEIKYKGNKDQAFTTTVINSNKNGIGSKKDKNKIS